MEYPEYFSGIARTASQLTLEQRKMEAALLSSYRTDVAIKVQMDLLDAAPRIVRRQIQLAIDEDGKSSDVSRAAQLVQLWTSKGYVQERASITLPEGSKVTIVTPDVVDVPS